jgi:hypothetical protein
MVEPPELTAVVLLYHWYDRVPKSTTEATIVKVADVPVGIEVLKGCVPMTGVWALLLTTTSTALLDIDVGGRLPPWSLVIIA